MKKTIEKQLIKNILTIIQILLILFSTSQTFAIAITEVDENTNNIEKSNIEENELKEDNIEIISSESQAHIEKENIECNLIQYFNQEKEEWTYISYPKSYYINSDNEKSITYCINQNVDKITNLQETIEPEVGQSNTQVLPDKAEKVVKILENGYPNVNIEKLGVETEEDGYLATSQAINWIIEEKNIEDIYQYFRPCKLEEDNKSFSEQNLENTQERGKKIIDAIYKLVDIAYNQNDEKIEIVEDGEFIQDEKEEYYSQAYKIATQNLEATFDNIEIKNAPKGTYVADINGENKTAFNTEETFKIMVPKNSINTDYTTTLNCYVHTNTYKLHYIKNELEENRIYVMLLKDKQEVIKSYELNIKGSTSSLKIINTDEIANNAIEGATFIVENEIIKEKVTTDKDGIIYISNLPQGKITIKQISTNEDYILEQEAREIELKYNETSIVNFTNTHKKGQIKIINTSEEKNNILKTEAGVPIEGTKFNIYNENNKLIEQVTTNKYGIALSNKLKVGQYFIQEVQTGNWYMPNNERYSVKISENNEVVELYTTNKSQMPNVEVENTNKGIIKSNEEIDYEFEIKNTGSTQLTNFTWYQILPIDYSKITKISTGTFNQNLNYTIYYKTNQKNEYITLKDNVNSNENNYIDLSSICLEEGEKITEIKIYFGQVDTDFANVEKLHIYMKANDNLENNTQIKNYTILEGYAKEYKVTDESTVESIVYNASEQKRLPRTGY